LTTSRGHIVSQARLLLIAPAQNGDNPPGTICLLISRSTRYHEKGKQRYHATTPNIYYLLHKQKNPNNPAFLNIVAP
jgi:hypothetical protein